ncbi:hypothetical protein D9M72_587740 [compost metagenome]
MWLWLQDLNIIWAHLRLMLKKEFYQKPLSEKNIQGFLSPIFIMHRRMKCTKLPKEMASHGAFTDHTRLLDTPWEI